MQTRQPKDEVANIKRLIQHLENTVPPNFDQIFLIGITSQLVPVTVEHLRKLHYQARVEMGGGTAKAVFDPRSLAGFEYNGRYVGQFTLFKERVDHLVSINCVNVIKQYQSNLPIQTKMGFYSHPALHSIVWSCVDMGLMVPSNVKVEAFPLPNF